MRSFWLPVWTGLLKYRKDLITYITEVFLQLVNVKNIICAAYVFSKVLEEIQIKSGGDETPWHFSSRISSFTRCLAWCVIIKAYASQFLQTGISVNAFFFFFYLNGSKPNVLRFVHGISLQNNQTFPTRNAFMIYHVLLVSLWRESIGCATI